MEVKIFFLLSLVFALSSQSLLVDREVKQEEMAAFIPLKVRYHFYNTFPQYSSLFAYFSATSIK